MGKRASFIFGRRASIEEFQAALGSPERSVISDRKAVMKTERRKSQELPNLSPNDEGGNLKSVRMSVQPGGQLPPINSTMRNKAAQHDVDPAVNNISPSAAGTIKKIPFPQPLSVRLRVALTRQRLERLEERLKELGVQNMDDMAFVRYEDLDHCELTEEAFEKLMNACKSDATP